MERVYQPLKFPRRTISGGGKGPSKIQRDTFHGLSKIKHTYGDLKNQFIQLLVRDVLSKKKKKRPFTVVSKLGSKRLNMWMYFSLMRFSLQVIGDSLTLDDRFHSREQDGDRRHL